MIHIKLVGMSIIFYCTKLHLSNKLGISNFNCLSRLCFKLLTKIILLKVVYLLKSVTAENAMVPHWLVQVLHPTQKFECLLLWNDWSYRIKMYDFEVTFNMTFLPNFVICSKVVMGTQTENCDLISLSFLFKESRLKILHKITEFCTQWFGVCPSLTTKICTIAIFKSFIK
jgi:hypothetical protein